MKKQNLSQIKTGWFFSLATNFLDKYKKLFLGKYKNILEVSVLGKYKELLDFWF